MRRPLNSHFSPLFAHKHRLRKVKMDQRKLMDNANTITDMAKVSGRSVNRRFSIITCNLLGLSPRNGLNAFKCMCFNVEILKGFIRNQDGISKTCAFTCLCTGVIAKGSPHIKFPSLAERDVKRSFETWNDPFWNLRCHSECWCSIQTRFFFISRHQTLCTRLCRICQHVKTLWKRDYQA